MQITRALARKHLSCSIADFDAKYASWLTETPPEQNHHSPTYDEDEVKALATKGVSRARIPISFRETKKLLGCSADRLGCYTDMGLCEYGDHTFDYGEVVAFATQHGITMVIEPPIVNADDPRAPFHPDLTTIPSSDRTLNGVDLNDPVAARMEHRRLAHPGD